MLSEYHAMDSLYYSAATCGRENLFEADGGGGTTATLQVCSVFSLDDSTLSESTGSGNGLFGAPQPCVDLRVRARGARMEQSTGTTAQLYTVARDGHTATSQGSGMLVV